MAQIKKASSLLNFSASTQKKDFFDSTSQLTGKTTEERGEREAGGEEVFSMLLKEHGWKPEEDRGHPKELLRDPGCVTRAKTLEKEQELKQMVVAPPPLVGAKGVRWEGEQVFNPTNYLYIKIQIFF